MDGIGQGPKVVFEIGPIRITETVVTGWIIIVAVLFVCLWLTRGLKKIPDKKRQIVAEIIREKVLLYYDKEIPYSVEVRVESFKENDRKIDIRVVIYVERDSQKGIIIGHQGVALKKLGTESRKSLEKFFGKKIYLETYVKVDKDWRSSDRELNIFGYNPE